MTEEYGITTLTRRCLRASRKILCPIHRPATSDTIARHPEVTHETESQPNNPWNLERISPDHATNDGSSPCHDDETERSGAYVYVIDSGIHFSHTEFSGRASHGVNFVPMSPHYDEVGHGTQMAGIIGGTTYGLAKDCTMISVKVVYKMGRGKAEWLPQAIEWATNDAIAKGVAEKSVMNMSLGWRYSAVINNAVKKATNAGITVVVSAGNEGKPASTCSPASASTAITVAASGPDNRRAPFSNYGLRVDIFAPGIKVPTVPSLIDDGPLYSSGTSPAAAYVSGLAAHFISSENLRGYKAVRKRIMRASLNGVIKDTRWSRNRLASDGLTRG
ncbi:cuticle-degrading protease [Fusarium pseudoanthophilum]|uniref:Cuticle-degrading protease n=1 Tax=Fusarium pseudoanthophilum TaxID=48495 RepID=A0A8H5USY8_9HYPO|nr:cuticle-degrading protease [Fusarium pseudoanthophilum]